MLSDLDDDELEELQARLYSQVHYSTLDDEPTPDSPQPNVEVNKITQVIFPHVTKEIENIASNLAEENDNNKAVTENIDSAQEVANTCDDVDVTKEIISNFLTTENDNVNLTQDNNLTEKCSNTEESVSLAQEGTNEIPEGVDTKLTEETVAVEVPLETATEETTDSVQLIESVPNVETDTVPVENHKNDEVGSDTKKGDDSPKEISDENKTEEETATAVYVPPKPHECNEECNVFGKPSYLLSSVKIEKTDTIDISKSPPVQIQQNIEIVSKEISPTQESSVTSSTEDIVTSTINDENKETDTVLPLNSTETVATTPVKTKETYVTTTKDDEEVIQETTSISKTIEANDQSVPTTEVSVPAEKEPIVPRTTYTPNLDTGLTPDQYRELSKQPHKKPENPLSASFHTISQYHLSNVATRRRIPATSIYTSAKNDPSVASFNSNLPEFIGLDDEHGEIVQAPRSLRAERRRQAKLKKNEEKRNEVSKIAQAANDAEIFRSLSWEDRKKVLKYQKRQRYKDRRKLCQQQAKAMKDFSPKLNTMISPLSTPYKTIVPVTEKDSDIISVSESNGSSVIALEEKREMLVVSSDEEDNISTKKPMLKQVGVIDEDNDDVIIIEQGAGPSVINLDPEPAKTDKEMMKPPSDDNHSVNSANTSGASNATPTKTKQLSAISESSNDFLDNTMDSPQNFGLNLQGSDISTPCLANQQKKKTVVDTAETESTCSDMSQPVPLRRAIFNEPEFDTPNKELFSDKNLKSFSDFITPKRPLLSFPSLLTTNEEHFEQVPTRVSNYGDEGEAELSSESDNDGNKSAQIGKKKTKLPNLSHFDTQISSDGKLKKKKDEVEESVTSTDSEEEMEVTKRVRKLKGKSSGEDIEEGDLDVGDTRKGKKKKKNRTKVSEQADEIAEDAEQTLEVVEDEQVSPKKKKKKQTSVTLDEIEIAIEQPSTEKKKKKKKSVVDENEQAEKSIEEDNQSNGDTESVKSKKKKKKRKESDSAEQEITELVVEAETAEQETLHKQKKKKKKKNDTDPNISINETVEEHYSEDDFIDPTILAAKGQKPKKKKKKQSESSEISIVSISEEANVDVTTEQRTKKKRKAPDILELESDVTFDDPVEKGSQKKKKKKSKINPLAVLEETRTSESDNHETPKQKRRKSVEIISVETGEGTTSQKKRKKKAQNQAETEGGENRAKRRLVSETHTRRDTLNSSSDIEILPDVPVQPIEIIDSGDSDISDLYDIKSIGESGAEDDFRDVDSGGEEPDLANLSNTSQRKRFSDFYNEDISTFHNQSWGEDSFDVAELQSSMSNDPEKWRILPADRRLIRPPSATRGPRCRRCREFGHIAPNCQNKQGPPKCSLCGDRGHSEPRCPNKLCTQCGCRSNYSSVFCNKCTHMRLYTCSKCNMTGHKEDFCPDNWRRYHLTPEENKTAIDELPQSPKEQSPHQSNDEAETSTVVNPLHKGFRRRPTKITLEFLLTKIQAEFLEANKQFVKYVYDECQIPLRIIPGTSSYAMIRICGNQKTASRVYDRLTDFMYKTRVTVNRYLLHQVRHIKRIIRRPSRMCDPVKCLQQLKKIHPNNTAFLKGLNLLLYGKYGMEDAKRHLKNLRDHYNDLQIGKVIDITLFNMIQDGLDYIMRTIRPIDKYKQLLESVIANEPELPVVYIPPMIFPGNNDYTSYMDIEPIIFDYFQKDARGKGLLHSIRLLITVDLIKVNQECRIKLEGQKNRVVSSEKRLRNHISSVKNLLCCSENETVEMFLDKIQEKLYMLPSLANQSGKQLYYSIRKLEIAPLKSERSLKELYSNLHGYLFGARKLLMGAQHLHNLYQWLRVYENSPNSIDYNGITSLRESYSYLFGEERRNINYETLLTLVP